MSLLHLLVALCQLVGHCWNLVPSSYEQALQWSPKYLAQSRTLNTLTGSSQNSSAILHFIELTHNFTAEDWDKCKRISLAALNFSVGDEAYEQFGNQADIAKRTSHLLTNLFTSHNFSLHHLATSKDFYWSLLLSNIQSHRLIFGTGISFSNVFLNNFLPNFKHFSPYMHRSESANNETIKINLAISPFKHMQALEGEDSPIEIFKSEWYWKLAFPDYESMISQWENTNVASLSQIKGVWSSPVMDCSLTKVWLTSYVVPFFKISVNSANLM